MKKAWIILISISVLVILGCSFYLIKSFKLVEKYDTNSFKLDKYEIPTFNSALGNKKRLLVATEKKNMITLKYDVSDIKMDHVFKYAEKLSSEGYVIVNYENETRMYMRLVHRENDIQVRIKSSKKYLIIEYNIGIDYNEKSSNEKEEKESSKIEEKKE